MRRAMSGVLPEPVLRRPKSTLICDPDWEVSRRRGLPPLVPAPRFEQYIDLTRVPLRANKDMIAFRTNFRVNSFNYWLRDLHQQQNPVNKLEKLSDELTIK